jgi:chemotaxis protein methyltransferase CheR
MGSTHIQERIGARMTPDDFKFYKQFLYEKSGYAITEEKSYLIETRLSSVIRDFGFNSLDQLTKSLRTAPDPKLVRAVVDGMTINETLFFRDARPFQQLKSTVLPAVLKSRESKKSLRLWSAACSTGQEPYSVAMILDEALAKLPGWKTEILGTDISDNALTQARNAKYNQFEIQRGLPIQMTMKYFTQDGQSWGLKDIIRNMVRFEAFNLLDRMDRFGTFDIIFCRNVLIYFDEETKKKVLQNLVKRLAPDGFLFLGGSETVIGLCPELKIQQGCPGLYTVQSSSATSKVSNIQSPAKPIISTATPVNVAGKVL